MFTNKILGFVSAAPGPNGEVVFNSQALVDPDHPKQPIHFVASFLNLDKELRPMFCMGHATDRTSLRFSAPIPFEQIDDGETAFIVDYYADLTGTAVAYFELQLFHMIGQQTFLDDTAKCYVIVQKEAEQNGK